MCKKVDRNGITISEVFTPYVNHRLASLQPCRRNLATQVSARFLNWDQANGLRVSHAL
jgi:hypothetical protein